MDISSTILPVDVVAPHPARRSSPFDGAYGYRPLTLREKLRDLLGGCKHAFGRPSSCLQRMRAFRYPEGYDAHQACTNCGVERFYNAKEMTHGPAFVCTAVAPPPRNPYPKF